MAARKTTRKATRKTTRTPARKRSWTAAKHNRLTSDWRASFNTIDQDLYSDLRTVRARARDLAFNNPHGRRFVRLMQMNVAGPKGFQMQSRVETDTGTPLESANNMVERAFEDWSQKGVCEVTGRFSFRDVQHLLLANVARDGEFLVKEITDPALPFGYGIQVLSPEMLDDQYNDRLQNGNTVVMGVELDKYRRPIAYHLKPEGVGIGDAVSPRDRERVPAEQMIHGFVPESSVQTRGISWMATAVLKMRMLGEYEIAALTKARVGATNLGFLAPSIEFAQGGMGSGQEDAAGNTVVNVEPMGVTNLDPGTAFTPWNNEYPTQQFEPFTKAVLRSIASALDVSYTSLSGDLSDTSYSSARVGLLDERESYRDRQEWFVDVFLKRVFRSWLEMANMGGKVSFPVSKFEKFAKAKWIGRRWAWVDPQKDITASILEIENNLATKADYLSEQGRDLSDVFKQRKREQDQEKELKAARPAPPPAPSPNGNGEEGQPTGTATKQLIPQQAGNGHE